MSDQSTDLLLLFSDLIQSKLPDISIALSILDKTKEILVTEPNVLEISSPCTIVGDIHGQFDDILPILIRNLPFVFLGDYVDRGRKSVELLLFICIKKIIYYHFETGNSQKEVIPNPKTCEGFKTNTITNPNFLQRFSKITRENINIYESADNFDEDLEPCPIYLIKGNHETPFQNEHYGFKEECLIKYDKSFWIKANELFDCMSICATVDKKYFLVHGGISPTIKHLSEIDFLDRSNYNSFLDLLWSDPREENGIQPSPRGAGCLFGPDELKKFLDRNDLEFLVRSHQLVQKGFKIAGRCIFVWSAPNYLGTAGNIASVMHITPFGYEPEFFDAENSLKLEEDTF